MQAGSLSWTERVNKSGIILFSKYVTCFLFCLFTDRGLPLIKKPQIIHMLVTFKDAFLLRGDKHSGVWGLYTE